MNDQGRPLVRARHGAARLPGATAPNDTIHYRIFHPARYTGAASEQQTGSLPPDAGLAPWPVAIVLGGINVNPDGYRWLATHLASAGIATVLFQCVGEISPGEVGLTPGLDLSALTPDAWGTRPSATAIGPLLEALAGEHAAGPLAGMLDLDRLALVGHSDGGTVALLNAEPAWFGVRAVVSYAGHTMPAAMLGHPTGTVLPVAAGVPALVLGGGDDAVIAASAIRYGAADGTRTHDPIAATYETAAGTPGSALVVLESATHLTFCDPVDPTTARGFLEEPDPAGPAHRSLIAAVVQSFLGGVLGLHDQAPDLTVLADLTALADDPLVSDFRC